MNYRRLFHIVIAMRKFPPLAYLQYVEHISTAYGFHEKFPAMSQFDTVK